MMSKSNIQLENSQSKEWDSVIKLSYFYNLFKRNKIIFTFLTLFFSISSFLYSLSKKPIWQGQFEIVIDLENKSKNSNLISPQLIQLAGIELEKGSSTLETEVGILRSPSVLLPVYDYVTSIKKENDKDFKKIDFNGWRKDNLQINLKENTSILQITYKDTNKKIIEPVLNRISFEYQKYSGKNKRRNIELAEEYLNNQIKNYKVRSTNSFNAAQSFAIDQDLITFQGIDGDLKKNDLANKNYEDLNIFYSNISIENVRSQASNAIKANDLKIKKINELDSESYPYLAALASRDSNKSIIDGLTELNAQIIERRSKYKNNDKGLLLLIKKRDLLVNLLKDKTIGYLETEKLNMQATMETATRPKGVILKYKELMREAARDEITLVKLEDQLRISNLEKAKLQDPWELITNPYLDEYAISNKKMITFIGFILGVSSSLIFSIFKEKKAGYIYEEEFLENILKIKVTHKFKLDELSELIEKNNYFQNLLFNNENSKIFFIGNLENSSIGEKIYKFQEKQNLSISNDFYELADAKEIYVFTNLDLAKVDEIKSFKNKIDFFKKDISGLFLLIP